MDADADAGGIAIALLYESAGALKMTFEVAIFGDIPELKLSLPL